MPIAHSSKKSVTLPTFFRQKKFHSFTHPCLRNTFIFIYTCTFIYLEIVQIKRWSCQCSMTFVLNSKNNISCDLKKKIIFRASPPHFTIGNTKKAFFKAAWVFKIQKTI